MTPEQFSFFVSVFALGLLVMAVVSERLTRVAGRSFDAGHYLVAMLIEGVSLALVAVIFRALWWFIGAYPF